MGDSQGNASYLVLTLYVSEREIFRPSYGGNINIPLEHYHIGMPPAIYGNKHIILPLENRN